jgi:hypothetical protein
LKRQMHCGTRGFHQFLLDRAKILCASGGNGCAMFAAHGIQAITGVDSRADFRGRQSEPTGAFAAIKSIAGGAPMADARRLLRRKLHEGMAVATFSCSAAPLLCLKRPRVSLSWRYARGPSPTHLPSPWVAGWSESSGRTLTDLSAQR